MSSRKKYITFISSTIAQLMAFKKMILFYFHTLKFPLLILALIIVMLLKIIH